MIYCVCIVNNHYSRYELQKYLVPLLFIGYSVCVVVGNGDNNQVQSVIGIWGIWAILHF